MHNEIQNVTSLILAGGKGTRIARLHPGIPKPTVAVAGKPFLSHLLEQLHEFGISNFVISTGFNADVLRERMDPHFLGNINLTYIQEPVPLGTGGGAAYAASAYVKQLTHQPPPRFILILNGDSILIGDWFYNLFQLSHEQPAIVVRLIEDVSAYGAVTLNGDYLAGFNEKGCKGSGLINGGIYYLPYQWLAELPEQTPLSFEENLFPLWLSQGRKIFAVRHDGPFLDIGTPESLRIADEFVAENRAVV
jgi:D-glycero-alpha-D-manno-heptose 1-phosphate guanylyltransferase